MLFYNADGLSNAKYFGGASVATLVTIGSRARMLLEKTWQEDAAWRT